MRRGASLQRRLLALTVGLVALLWIVAAALVWWNARHELDELLDAHLAQGAAMLVAQHVGEFEDDEHRVQEAPKLHRYAPRAAFQVWHGRKLVLRSSDAPTAPMGDEGRLPPPGLATVRIAGRPWRVMVAPGAEREVTVVIGEPLSSRAEILRGVLRGALLPLLLALPLLGLLLWIAVRHGLQPLRALRDALAAHEPDALRPVELPVVPAEMAPMLDALNALFGRIAALVESERRFTADAAHELRTPIAAIRTQAQVALGERDGAARRHALEATIEGCDRAARLVDQLLTLARLEAAGEPARAVVELAGVARRVAAELAPAALAREQSIELDAAAPCPVHGDGTLLAVLLRNLVDNALRYAPAGARIRVQVRREEGRVLARVEDSGPGLSDADRERLGERFFRVLGNEASGSGLGWSIARRIAAVHHAELATARSAELGGLAVTLRIAPADERAGAPVGA